MNNQSHLSLDDDDFPDIPNCNGVADKDAASMLAEAALEKALNKKTRSQLKQAPGVFIFHVPGAAWIDLIVKALKSRGSNAIIHSVSERKKTAGTYHSTGKDYLDYLQSKRSIAFVCHDPADLLDEEVLLSVDVTVTIAPLSPELLRKTIRGVTGGLARGLSEDCADLPLDTVLSAIRPGLTARQCVSNLHRALARSQNPKPDTVPRLDQLPLTRPVREWCDDTLAELQAVRQGTLSPDRLAHGVLEGPPGTGKTLIANSLAASAGWDFVESSVGSWFTSGDGYLGGVIKNLKKFFDDTLAAAPVIGFLDEIDAIPDRAGLDAKGREWWTPVITLFLTQIDRVRKSGKKVLLLGATNYYTRLDDALVRPGRLQQRISIFPPQTEDEALALLEHFAGHTVPQDQLAGIARLGIGATPAVIEGAWKEAQRIARQSHRNPQIIDIIEALTPQETRSPADLRSIALHEIGHAVVAQRLGHHVDSVSIIPNGPSEGHTIAQAPTIVPTRQHLEDLVTIGMGGRAADIVIGDGPNAGAEGDLLRATELLLAARLTQGLGDSLVSHALAKMTAPPALLSEIDSELQTALNRAKAIIEADREVIISLADRLISEKFLKGDEIAAALNQHAAPSLPFRTSDSTERDMEGKPSAPLPDDDSAPELDRGGNAHGQL